MNKKNKHFGSSFDSFLEQEGIKEEVELIALKRSLAYGLLDEMEKKNITKTKMAEKLGTSRAALNRLLDPQNSSITLNTLSRVATVLGKRLTISFK